MNTERKTALIACTLFFALYALLNYFQFTELRQLERNAFLSKLQNQVPVIQKNAQVQQLAIRKALNITAGPSTLNRNNKEVKENLLGKFKGIKLILWDKTLERIIADGFSLKEITSWQYMMKDYFRSYVNSETAMKESFKVHSTFEEKLKFRFRQSQFPNFLNFAGLKFEGKDGILLLGLISKWPENQKSIVQETAIASKPKEFSKNLRRGLVIFIPSSAYDNYEWFSRNFSQVIDNNDLIMAQEQQIIEKLKAGYKNGRKLAKKFISARRTSLNGAITHQDQGFIFCQTSLKMPGQKSSLVALLPFTRKDKEFYPGLLINQVFLIAGLLLIFMLFTKRIPTNFSKNISRQFIILLAAACIIPFSELCRQFFIHRKSESLKSAANIFNKLEERLEKVELDNSLKVSSIVKQINDFNRLYEQHWANKKPVSEKVIFDLEKYGITQFYHGSRNGSLRVFDTKPAEETSKRRSSATSLLKILVRFVQINIGFSKDELSNSDSIKIGSFTDAMGMRTLFNLAMAQDELLPFQFAHGAVWIYTSIIEFADKTDGFAFYLLARNEVQNKLIDRWQRTDDKKYPQIVFMELNKEVAERVAPTWVETRPELLELLKHITDTGERIRTRISIDKKPFFVAGRRLKGMYWSAIALEPAFNDSVASESRHIFIAISAIYLILVSLLISKIFSGFFIRPVKSLTDAVISIASGNYDLKAESTDKDELGQLCQSFNEMSGQLKEKEFLSRFLSATAKDAISGKVKSHATKVRGTILFSDIRSFTTLTEKYQPEEIVEMLNSYMTEMEKSIENHGGTIEKFIGDAIMAVFLPIHGQPPTTLRAYLAAKEMCETLEQYNQKRLKKNQFMIDNGVGLATGSLLMGTIGNIKGRRDYTITGKTVLLAADMEKVTKFTNDRKYRIAVCKETARMLKKEQISSVELKNPEQITAFETIQHF